MTLEPVKLASVSRAAFNDCIQQNPALAPLNAGVKTHSRGVSAGRHAQA
ncbi:MAG: hypothetical protein ACREVE_00455 [Gammaproteobacteria bacterium]